MSEIKLKERKPTWDYILNDLAFSSLKTRVLYGIFDDQDRFDFEYQIELKIKEIEKLNKRWNVLRTYINEMWLDDKGSVRRLQEFVNLLENGNDN